jgi:hypothetical protein
MFRAFADRLSATDVSVALQNAEWVIPTSQSIHIVSVSVLFASAIMINLRLLGVGAKGRSISQLSGTVLPWMWRALLVLLLTGTVQTVAEPVRQFVAPVFWTKMILIVIVSLLTLCFARAVRRNAAIWDASGSRPGSARVFAVISSLLWIAIIFCGRFIGYTYSFYLDT